MLLEAGHVIDGKYRLVRVIGTGGMGAVYEGENTFIRRRVAIKVLHAENTNNAESVRRFEREAQAAGQIGNDHILEVLDLGSLPNGDRYLVMEYLDGETLAQRIEHLGRLTPTQIAPLARQFLEALVSAHAAGIIHRDLKPENIFILRSKAGRTDFVKLIDFGISKFSRPFGDGEQRMTRADAVLGTPCYMSPEQARGASKTDVRSDIYSCGVILYEAVTGRLPFEGTSFNDLMFKIALQDVPSPLSVQPDLDPEFAAIISRAIARDPNKRFATALEFAQELDAWSAKNGVTEALGYTPPPPESIRQVILRNAPTLAGEDEKTSPALNTAPSAAVSHDLRKTGTEESWARSKVEPLPQAPPGSRRRTIAFASAAGLVIVGLAIAMLARPGSPTTTASPSAAPAAQRAADPWVAPQLAASASATLAAETATAPSPTAPEPAASSAGAGAAAHHEPPKPGATTTAAAATSRPATAAPVAKPRPKATGVKGFDLGY